MRLRIAGRSFSLRISLGTAFVAICVVTALVLGTVTYLSLRSYLRDGVRRRLATITSLAAMAIDGESHRLLRTRADERLDAYREIRATLRGIRKQAGDVRFIYTTRLDERGQIVFVVDAEDDPRQVSHLGDVYPEVNETFMAAFTLPWSVHVEKKFTTDSWGTFLSGFAPFFTADGSLEGVVGVDLSAAGILAYERRFMGLAILLTLGVALLMAGVGILVARRVSRPLLRLAEDMERVKSLDLEGGGSSASHITEVVAMQAALGKMKTGLRSFRKYVPAELVARLVAQGHEAVLGAEKRELTMMFTDIEGFTSFAEQVSQDDVVTALSLYFDRMTGVILEGGGTVDKYIGDSIMAFYGAPTENPGHALAACRTALRCRRALDELLVDFASRGLPPFHTRFGINTGVVSVGNFGYGERLNYTVIGDAVNLASRLEGINKVYGTAIIISQYTYEQAREGIEARYLDLVAVKGKSRAVRLYELVAERGKADAATTAFLGRYDAGMGYYAERRWRDAAEVFEGLVSERPDDRASEIMAERCRKFMRQPPPDNWSGTCFVARS